MNAKAFTSTAPPPNRKPRKTPETSTAKRGLRVRPTRFGNTFLMILAAMLVVFINSNNNLGLLLTFLLGSMATVSILHTRRNLSGIQLVRLRAKPVFAGEKAQFEIHLRQPAKTAHAVEVALPAADPVCVDLVNGSPATVTIGIPAGKRGLLAPGPLQILTRYPFGLFQARRHLPHSAACIVYPHPISGSLETAPGEPVAGHGTGQTGPGVEDFVGLKAYQPGDNLGQISWKAYSRGRGLLIKQFSGESGRTLTIDWHMLKEPALERKLSRLCHMVLQAHQSRLPFALRLPAVTLAPARGANHLKTCLVHLALFGLPGGAGKRETS